MVDEENTMEVVYMDFTKCFDRKITEDYIKTTNIINSFEGQSKFKSFSDKVGKMG